MDARFAQQEFPFLLPANRPRAMQDAEALRLAALRARDEAIGRAVARAARGAWNGLKALLALPRRQAVFTELSRLSDRELADIGLTRGDIGRVFDADFAARTETARQAAERLRPANAHGRFVAAA